MIIIHYDYSDGSEISYIEGKKKEDNFSTCCLDFFSMDTEAEVIVLKSNGEYISKNNIQEHIEKRIIEAHNIHKMLKANAFEFKPNYDNFYKNLMKDSEEIYKQLGNKTKSENVEITNWSFLKKVNNPILDDKIVSTRMNNEFHFGNLYTASKDTSFLNKDLTLVSNVKIAVIKYIHWVLNSKCKRAKWIREKLISKELVGKTILYYSELNQPSHATALDFLINKFDLKNI